MLSFQIKSDFINASEYLYPSNVPAGTLEGYKYSEALIKSDLIWNESTINQLFDEGPDKVTPGTKMPIQRMKKYEDRRDLIKYLKKVTN